MKFKLQSLLLSSILFATGLVRAQDYFPLQVGNHWQYEVWFGGTFRGYYDIKIIADSTMPNGKKYYRSTEPWEWGRVGDSLKTYRYRPSDSTEVLMDKFQSSPGDWWFSFKYGSRDSAILESAYNTTLFGEIVNVKGISRYTTGGLWLTTEHYTQKHGLFYFAVEGGASYYLVGARVGGITYGTIVSVEEQPLIHPVDFRLEQNYPNPFNPRTTIEFNIPRRSLVVLKVYDLLGQEVSTLVNEELNVGRYKVSFDASALSSGVYISRLVTDRKLLSKKMILMK